MKHDTIPEWTLMSETIGLITDRQSLAIAAEHAQLIECWPYWYLADDSGSIVRLVDSALARAYVDERRTRTEH